MNMSNEQTLAQALDNAKIKEKSLADSAPTFTSHNAPGPQQQATPSFDSFPVIPQALTAISMIPTFSSFPADMTTSTATTTTATATTAITNSNGSTDGYPTATKKHKKIDSKDPNRESKRLRTRSRSRSRSSDRVSRKKRSSRRDDDSRDRRHSEIHQSRDQDSRSTRRHSSRDRDRDRDQDRGENRYDRRSNSDRHGHSSSRYEEERVGRESDRTRRRDRANDNERNRDGDRDRDRRRDRVRDLGRSGRRHSRSRSRSADRKQPDDQDNWKERRAQEKSQGEYQQSSFAKQSAKQPKPGEWILDVKGDPNLLRYDGTSQYERPSYARIGGGRVLGLPSHMRIDYERTRALGSAMIVMRDGPKYRKAQRYTDLNLNWRDRSYEYKRITRAKAEELARTLGHAQEDPSFISLDIRKNTVQNQPSSDEEMEDTEGISGGDKSTDYRDIHGKSVYKDQDEDLLQTTSDQEEEGAESALDTLRRRRVALDAELHKDPKNPHNWLEFISIEDDIELITNRRAHAGSRFSRAHSEAKLSIFDKALKYNPTDEQLLLEYMNCYRHAHPPAEVLTKWDSLLQSNQIRTAWPGLWIEYLDFRQRHFLSFSVESFVSLLQDALDNLGSVTRSIWRDIQQGDDKFDMKTKSRLVRFESVMVHIIARACTFLKEAGKTQRLVLIEVNSVHEAMLLMMTVEPLFCVGYIERAQAILQGQIEFLFNTPRELQDKPFNIRLGSLGLYWDSEVPRFGEKDAKGWAYYFTTEGGVEVENLMDNTTLPATVDPMDELFQAFTDPDKDRFEYGRWARVERELNSVCWFPIRPSNSDDIPKELENDPYGVIVFEDIRPFIVDFHTVEARIQFTDCMFHFLGLPVSMVAGSNEHLHQRQSDISAMTENNAKQPIGVGTYNPYIKDSLLLNIGLDNTFAASETNSGMDKFFPPVVNRERAIEMVMKEIESSSNGQADTQEYGLGSVWNLPLKIFPHTPDVLFGKRAEKDKELPRYPWAAVSDQDEIQHANKSFISKAFKQLIEVLPVEETYRHDLSLYQLMVSTFDKMESTLPSAHATLATETKLDVWNSYALCEKALGNESGKIYKKTLSLYHAFPEVHQQRAPLLHRFYAELEWEQGRPGVALEILILLTEGVPVNVSNIKKNKDSPFPAPTRIVKARQYYSQRVARLQMARPSPTANTPVVTRQWFEPALDLIVCYAWFEYLAAPKAAAGGEVEAGVKVFENAIQELDLRNPDSEVMVEDAAKEMSLDQSVLWESINMRSILLPPHLYRGSGNRGGVGREGGGRHMDETEKHRTRSKKICTSVETEMVWVQLAKMVYFHSIRVLENSKEKRRRGDGAGIGGGFQPKALRRIVHAGLERFPNCSILQSLYFWTEAKQRVHGRVRTWVHDQLNRVVSSASSLSGTDTALPSSAIGHKSVMLIFGLYYELWHQETYNIHTLRTMLESALDSSQATSFSSSPNLWMIYLELEVREYLRLTSLSEGWMSESLTRVELNKMVKKTQRQQDKAKKRENAAAKAVAASRIKVKQILDRAIADCPWYKNLYLFAFDTRVRSLFTLEELERYYETMLTKELRVRKELPVRISQEEEEKEEETYSSDEETES
ncbi:hypothetical protein BG004_007671 [Podila humilis]|nr:hypothetical protein BG004_007671 [Podila humilis]